MHSSFKKYLALCLGSAALASPLGVSATEVDLLLLYDGDTETRFNGQPAATLRSWVDQINTIYVNSKVDIQLRLVGTLRHDPAGSTMFDVLNNVGPNSFASSKRDEYGADFVSQIHAPTGLFCGLSPRVTGLAADAYSVVDNTCGAVTLAHELGHNMGLNHSRLQKDEGGGLYPYGLGYGVNGLFCTVMAYPSFFGASRLSVFSNPNLSCMGVPCGVPVGQPEQAFAGLALNNARANFAAFRPARIPGGGGSTGSIIVNNGIYTLKAKHSGKCADVTASGTQNGANVQQWSCHGGSNQRWQFVDRLNGYYEIKAQNSGKCLDLSGGGTSNGTNIQTWTCNRTDAQLWKITKISDDNTFYLTAKVNNNVSNKVEKVMGVNASSTDNGANVQQWSYWGGKNQQWTATRVQ